MSAVLKIRLGSKVLEISTEQKGEKMFEDLGFYSQLPDKCGKCNSQDIGIFHKNIDGNPYTGLVCLSCGAEYTFGKHRQGGTFFPKQDKNTGKPVGWIKFAKDAITDGR